MNVPRSYSSKALRSSSSVFITIGPYQATGSISDRLDAAVGMPGEPRAILLGIVGAKVIEQQKGIEIRRFVEPEHPLEMYARPFGGWFVLPYF